MDLPYFSFYPGDWLSDPNVQAMTLEETGAYINLLVSMWLKGDGCTFPDDDKLLARTLHVSTRKWRQLRGVLVDGEMAVFHKTGDGRLFNPRMVKEFEKASKRIEDASKAGRASAVKRSVPTDDQRPPNDRSTPVPVSLQRQGNQSDLELEPDLELEKHKTHEEEDRPRATTVDVIKKHAPAGMSRGLEHDFSQCIALGAQSDLVDLAFKTAVERNANVKESFALKVLQGWVNSGILTAAQYKASEAQRQSAATTNGGVRNGTDSAVRAEPRGSNGRTRSFTGGKVGRV